MKVSLLTFKILQNFAITQDRYHPESFVYISHIELFIHTYHLLKKGCFGSIENIFLLLIFTTSQNCHNFKNCDSSLITQFILHLVVKTSRLYHQNCLLMS